MTDFDSEYRIERVNVNTASEEVLMTLPGVTRPIAQSVIEYRQQIGGFRLIEDLALVSGIGASKLALLKPEVCVASRNLSANSSFESSQQDFFHDASSTKSHVSTSTRQATSGKRQVIVNINTANVFQLMRTRGLTQSLAENIVIYREKRGNFRSVDDLVKVKGITRGHVASIQQYLTTSATAPPVEEKIEEELSGPFMLQSVRASPKTAPKACDVTRIATWNLDACSLEKAQNIGVMEVFAMICLEHR